MFAQCFQRSVIVYLMFSVLCFGEVSAQTKPNQPAQPAATAAPAPITGPQMTTATYADW